jgi:hypothetical protein
MFSSSLSLSKHPEIVVLGSIAVDFVAYTNVLPQIGETVFGTSFAKNFGGKGANQVTSETHFQLECSTATATEDFSLHVCPEFN